MFYLAIGCAVVATIVLSKLSWMLLRGVYDHSKPILQEISLHAENHSNKNDRTAETHQKYRTLWRMTDLLGRPLQRFVTWGQRRRLSLHIERAGLKRWLFYQIYFFQCLFSSISLLISVWCLERSLLDMRVAAYICLILCVIFGWWLPIMWLKRRHHQRVRQIIRQFPFFLDMVGLGLDAGLNLQASVRLALEHIATGALHQEWSKMLADMRAGQSRAQALRQLSQRLNISSIRQLISSLIQGESMGFSLGHIIQVYADQQRAQRLMQAEKQALQAPVKMLFPMALCIFPCTFMILGFPVAVQLLGLS